MTPTLLNEITRANPVHNHLLILQSFASDYEISYSEQPVIELR